MPSATLPTATLPIFDFSKFRKGETDERKKTADEIVEAFKTYGFVYLVNHGIAKDKVQELFDWGHKFFALPEEVRMDPAVVRPVPEPGQMLYQNRGYSPIGREKLSQEIDDVASLEKLRAVPDVKDSFDMGPSKGIGSIREPNRYPPENVFPGFEAVTQAFYAEAQDLGMDIFRAIASGLGLEENYFVDYHQDADNIFRIIRYPPIERASMRAGTAARTTAHTDYGSITILFQDDVGGLEVENPAKPGTYVGATPIEGAVIVNIGDFLMRWTNDILKSTLHRVVEPPADQELSNGLELTKERFSIPYFIEADRSKIVECVKGLEGEGSKYPPISPGEYLARRVTAAYKTFEK